MNYSLIFLKLFAKLNKLRNIAVLFTIQKKEIYNNSSVMILLIADPLL